MSAARIPRDLAIWILVAVLTGACSAVPISRRGAANKRIVSRTFAVPAEGLRARLLDQFSTANRGRLPAPFRGMQTDALEPPRYAPDWSEDFADPGGYMDDYRRHSPEERARDLLIDDPTGDLYWPSEYVGPDGPVHFRCAFVVHFGALGPNETTVEVYEQVPTVWAGEHWAWAAHGIGFAKVHDIRFVEPTMKDRLDLLNVIAQPAAGG